MLSPNRQGKLWLNVASSKYVLEDFVNLDNSVWLAIPGFLEFVLRKQYRDEIQEYREAQKRASLIRHDCRKPLPIGDAQVDHILCSHFLEHVYPGEAEGILRDFHRALKPGGTVHIIVPDLKWEVTQYLNAFGNGNAFASDDFIDSTLLAKKDRGSLKFRVMQLMGAFGLQHHWMYDRFSITARVQQAGFTILDTNDTPSKQVRATDEYSVHVVGVKAL